MRHALMAEVYQFREKVGVVNQPSSNDLFDALVFQNRIS